jgi:hypothetical protein
MSSGDAIIYATPNWLFHSLSLSITLSNYSFPLLPPSSPLRPLLGSRRAQLMERIEQYPSPTQRLRNPYDPIAHPAVLVRYTKPTVDYEFNYECLPRKQLFVASPYEAEDLRPLVDHNSTVQPEFLNAATGRGAASPKRPSTAMKRRPARKGPRVRSTNASRRPGTAKPATRRGKRSSQSSADSHFHADSTHTTQVTVTDPYKKLKGHLFDLIVEHRIFREVDLAALFRKARELNVHLDSDVFDKIELELRNELRMSPMPDNKVKKTAPKRRKHRATPKKKAVEPFIAGVDNETDTQPQSLIRQSQANKPLQAETLPPPPVAAAEKHMPQVHVSDVHADDEDDIDLSDL